MIMDSKSNCMSWTSKLCQKTETFLDEVDVLITQESLRYVENQLLTASENVKQYCSEFIMDVLNLTEEEVPYSLGENEKSGVLASEMVSIGLGNEHQKVSCNSESSVHELSVEQIKELCKDSSLRNQHDTGMSIGIEQNAKSENLFSYEIQEVIASANENANDISVPCGMRQPNNEVNLSTVVPKLLGDDPISESRGMSRDVDVKDDVSTSQPTILSIVSAATHELSLWMLVVIMQMIQMANSLPPEFGTCMILKESQTPLGSDSSNGIHQFTKLGVPTTMPISKLKLDDSCIVVDCNEICSESEAKHLYRQKYLRRAFSSIVKFARERKPNNATFSEDLNEESDKLGGRYLSPALATVAFESMDQEFCESEWEII